MSNNEDWLFVNDGKLLRALKRLGERGWNFATWGLGFLLGFAAVLATVIVVKYH